MTNQVTLISKSNIMMFDLLSELGHEVYWAANFSRYIGDLDEIPCGIVQVDCASNPFNKTNLKAYRQISSAISDLGIDAIHCHTPIGSLLGRVAGRRKKIKPIIYTAHGFLFYEGMGAAKRCLFELEESVLSGCSDALVTINEMDYRAAKKLNLPKNGCLYKVHGAGIETNIARDQSHYLRTTLGLAEDDVVCFSAARIDANKNIGTVLQALHDLGDKRVHYVIAGDGPVKADLVELTHKLGLEKHVHFLGFCSDIDKCLSDSDIFVISSIREGLSRSLLEGMSYGLPCVASDARGNTDLIKSGEGGYICRAKVSEDYARAIKELAGNDSLRASMGSFNAERVSDFSLSRVRQEYQRIYKEILQ